MPGVGCCPYHSRVSHLHRVVGDEERRNQVDVPRAHRYIAAEHRHVSRSLEAEGSGQGVAGARADQVVWDRIAGGRATTSKNAREAVFMVVPR